MRPHSQAVTRGNAADACVPAAAEAVDCSGDAMATLSVVNGSLVRTPTALLSAWSWQMLSGMPAMPWQEQVAYYRSRAAEYDMTSYGDLARADRRIAALVGQLHPGGDLLELACGTGLWTRHLATSTRSVTAIDAAPEMIALAGSSRTTWSR
jgi:hypothetical protein